MGKRFECTQCGSTQFDKIDETKLKCVYCKSLYEIPRIDKKGEFVPQVIIKKGANVVFGKNSNVEIRGDLIVEDGAHVSFLGKLTLVEKSTDEEIENAKMKLKNDSDNGDS